MSMKDVREFCLMIEKDQTLKKDIKKVNTKYKNKEIKLNQLPNLINEEIIPIAQKRGFSFTSEEFINCLKEENGVTEQDLLDVSGGLSPKQAALGLSGVLLLSFGTGIGAQFIARSVDNNSQQRIEQRIDDNKRTNNKVSKNQALKEVREKENTAVKHK